MLPKRLIRRCETRGHSARSEPAVPLAQAQIWQTGAII